MPDLGVATWPSAALGAAFAAAAVGVWLAGTRLARQADGIVARTGIGETAAGLLLLGGITSLPEVAVTVTATARGHAALAVNNILGGIAFQVTILAVADAFIGRRALSSVVTDPRTLLQGAFCVLALALIAAGVTVGERRVLGVGAWAAAVGLCYAVAIRMVARAPRRGAWRVPLDAQRERGRSEEQESEPAGSSLRRLVLGTAATAALILVAGYALSRTGETIAERTGLGTSFVGAVLVAFATSLPEVSTVVAAARLRRYEMAVSDVFGTNLADAALVLVADLIASGPPVLGQLGAFSVFAALLGIVLTTLYVAGLLERDDRAVLRMGVDSLAVLIAYGIGVVVLYHLR